MENVLSHDHRIKSNEKEMFLRRFLSYKKDALFAVKQCEIAYSLNKKIKENAILDFDTTIECLFNSTIFSTYHKDYLTESEKKEFKDIIELGILTPYLTKPLDFEDRLNNLVEIAYVNITSSLKKLYSELLKDTGVWFYTELTEQDFFKMIKAIKTHIFTEEGKQALTKFYSENINKWLSYKIAKIDTQNNNIFYLLDFNVSIDDMINNKRLFKISKFVVNNCSINHSGELIELIDTNEHLPSRERNKVHINNEVYKGITIYKAENTLIFSDKNEALAYGENKSELLKKALSDSNFKTFDFF